MYPRYTFQKQQHPEKILDSSYGFKQLTGVTSTARGPCALAQSNFGFPRSWLAAVKLTSRTVIFGHTALDGEQLSTLHNAGAE